MSTFSCYDYVSSTAKQGLVLPPIASILSRTAFEAQTSALRRNFETLVGRSPLLECPKPFSQQVSLKKSPTRRYAPYCQVPPAAKLPHGYGYESKQQAKD